MRVLTSDMNDSKAPLERANWIIGSDPGCDIFVNDPSVAGRHCKLHRKSDRWFVTALDGSVGIQRQETGDDQYDWTNKTTPVLVQQRVMLTDSKSLPWPIPGDGQRAYTVGRAVDCDIVVDGTGISGRHAILVPEGLNSAVLHDFASTNGVFIDASRRCRVTSVALSTCEAIYFGSQSIQSKTLLTKMRQAISTDEERARSKTRPSRTQEVTQPPRRQETGRRISASTKTLAGVVAPTLVLAIMMIWYFGDSSTQRVAIESLPKLATTLSETNTARTSLDDANLRASQRSVENVTSSSEPSGPPNPRETDVPFQPADSLYWIVMQHRETEAWFRLATVVAVRTHVAVTAGTAIDSIRVLKEEGYQSPSLVRITTGERLPIKESSRTPFYDSRMIRQNQIAQDHNELVKLIESKITESENTESADLKVSLARSEQLLQIAKQAASAVDLGWLTTSKPLVPVDLDRNIQFRPGMRLTLLRGDLSREDPFFEMSRSHSVSEDETRIHGRFPESEGLPGVLSVRLRDFENLKSQTLFGLPLMRDGRLAAIVVSETSPAFSSPETMPDSRSGQSATPTIICAETIGHLLESI